MWGEWNVKVDLPWLVRMGEDGAEGCDRPVYQNVWLGNMALTSLKHKPVTKMVCFQEIRGSLVRSLLAWGHFCVLGLLALTSLTFSLFVWHSVYDHTLLHVSLSGVRSWTSGIKMGNVNSACEYESATRTWFLGCYGVWLASLYAPSPQHEGGIPESQPCRWGAVAMRPWWISAVLLSHLQFNPVP